MQREFFSWRFHLMQKKIRLNWLDKIIEFFNSIGQNWTDRMVGRGRLWDSAPNQAGDHLSWWAMPEIES
jgi:hypothetical protein